MYNPLWGDKPYYSVNEYCKHTYHEKLYKIAIDAGFTCPNRDGTLDTHGCIFCSAGGSGDFAVKMFDKKDMMQVHAASYDTASVKSVTEQIQEGLSLFKVKQVGTRFIAYFQAYTNTYAPVEHLRNLYTQALSQPDIAGISIATRPDCLPEECLDLLVDLQTQFPDKFIWVELGLQTMHEATATFIRRGYPLSVFEKAMDELTNRNIPVIVHIILGLPGETTDMVLKTIQYLNQLPIFGIKLQLLHVLKDTDLATDYLAEKFKTLSKEDYMSLLILCLRNLSPDIVIHRLTGDGPKDLLIAPKWSLYKRDFFNALHRHLKQTGEYQGQDFIEK